MLPLKTMVETAICTGSEKTLSAGTKKLLNQMEKIWIDLIWGRVHYEIFNADSRPVLQRRSVPCAVSSAARSTGWSTTKWSTDCLITPAYWSSSSDSIISSAIYNWKPVIKTGFHMSGIAFSFIKIKRLCTIKSRRLKKTGICIIFFYAYFKVK